MGKRDGYDRSSILFVALSRPSMCFGVPFEAFCLNVLGTFFAGIWLSGPSLWRSPLMFWLMGIPIHMGLRRACSYDYYVFRTFRLWAMTNGTGRTSLESLPTQRARSGKDLYGSV